MQLIQFNKCLTKINQKEKQKLTQNNIDIEMGEKMNNDIKSISISMEQEDDADDADDTEDPSKMILTNLPSQCLQYITTFLSISEISKSFNNVCSTLTIIGSQEIKKTNSYFINADDLIIKSIHQNDKHYLLNVVDIGGDSFLKQIRTFKDDTLLSLFSNMALISNIPIKELIIFSYTVRNNNTVRPNRKISLDFDENNNENNNFITKEMKISHCIPTNPALRIKVTSIHEMVDNKPKYESFYCWINEKLVL